VESNPGIPQIRAFFIQGYAACPVTGSSRERYLRGEAQVQIVPQETREEVLVSIFAKDLLEYFKESALLLVFVLSAIGRVSAARFTGGLAFWFRVLLGRLR